MPLDLWRSANERILEEFLPELAEHLRRTPEDVRETGILGTEFPYQRVRVYYGDETEYPDSVCDFGFAFPIISRRREAIAVFAQHAGYFVFNHLCIVALREDRASETERIVWGPGDWWKKA